MTISVHYTGDYKKIVKEFKVNITIPADKDNVIDISRSRGSVQRAKEAILQEYEREEAGCYFQELFLCNLFEFVLSSIKLIYRLKWSSVNVNYSAISLFLYSVIILHHLRDIPHIGFQFMTLTFQGHRR